MFHPQPVAIVDDDDSVRFALDNLLRSAGLESRTFADADSFLADDLCWKTPCIVTDYHMPGRDGVALQAAVRERRPEVAVILMTAYPDETVRRRAREGGAIAFLTKPVDPDELLALVEQAVSAATALPGDGR